MTQRFFIDQDGAYLGSFDGLDEELPGFLKGATEVSNLPSDTRQVWDGKVWLPLNLPEPVKIVYSVHLWERMTDAEADQVGAEIQRQSFRLRNIFQAASSYRSDHELWLLLQQITTTLFGEARAAAILAPSELVAPL